MISIEFKGSKIFSLDDLKDLNKNKVLLFLINDISFSLILYIWFIFYKFGIITSVSPFFGLIIENVVILEGFIIYSYNISL